MLCHATYNKTRLNRTLVDGAQENLEQEPKTDHDLAQAGRAQLPRWDLRAIYSSLEGKDWIAAKKKCLDSIARLEACLHKLERAEHALEAEQLLFLIDCVSRLSSLYANLSSYVYAHYSVATDDPLSLSETNAIESLGLPLQAQYTRFRNLLNQHSSLVKTLCMPGQPLEPYRFVLEEQIFLASRQLSPQEEAIVSDLQRSGSEAFCRLQEALSASLSCKWHDGRKKTMVELRGLAHDPDPKLRELAWQKEIDLWHQHRIAFAASLNGCKGTALSLDQRRGWKSNLEKSLNQSRLSERAMDLLIANAEKLLPSFRRYLKAKARFLDKPQLAFYDLFAPLDSQHKTWSFAEARIYIIERFSEFSPELGQFAMLAIDEKWIDAQARSAKVGGAYCIDFPETGQSRIMVNFTGSFDSVITLAHELGHAWHSHLLAKSPWLLRDYPMTLAETASLFCETIVFDAELARAKGQQRLVLLEMRLSDLCQIIVDILSRYYFEKKVFEIRAERELQPEEFCRLMLDAQEHCYGDALTERWRHAYMWAAKGHYYHAELNFYNYPYAFGQLFALGLHAAYKEQSNGFVERYKALLIQTGSLDCSTLCRQVGIDIENQSFWQGSLDQINDLIDEFDKI